MKTLSVRLTKPEHTRRIQDELQSPLVQVIYMGADGDEIFSNLVMVEIQSDDLDVKNKTTNECLQILERLKQAGFVESYNLEGEKFAC